MNLNTSKAVFLYLTAPKMQESENRLIYKKTSCILKL